MTKEAMTVVVLCVVRRSEVSASRVYGVTWALCLPGRERGRRYSRCHRQRRALRAGQIATPPGFLPTVMGADTAPVAVVITDTVPSPLLAR